VCAARTKSKAASSWKTLCAIRRGEPTPTLNSQAKRARRIASKQDAFLSTHTYMLIHILVWPYIHTHQKYNLQYHNVLMTVSIVAKQADSQTCSHAEAVSNKAQVDCCNA
jgi:hypothetical protein